MKKLFTGITLAVLMLISIPANAQTGKHVWKSLIVNEDKKIWYDESSITDIKGNAFDVYLLQMYVPPLRMNGIKGEIYRSKTLYTVNLDLVKYGIKEVVYYNSENAEIYKHDYGITDYEDNLKYTYPVLENSPIHLVIKEIYKNKGTTTE